MKLSHKRKLKGWLLWELTALIILVITYMLANK